MEAIKDGDVVATVVKEFVTAIRLEAITDTADLSESETYDVDTVRIRAVDQNGNTAGILDGTCEPVGRRANGNRGAKYHFFEGRHGRQLPENFGEDRKGRFNDPCRRDKTGVFAIQYSMIFDMQ